MQNNLIWFRNDLRIYDNIALHAACKSDTDKVIALFIFTPQQWRKHFVSSKKISFTYHHVISLKKELFKLNIILYCHECTDFLDSIEYLVYFCDKHQITHLFYNYQYEFNERNRDCIVKKKLSAQGTLVKGFHSNLLVPYQHIKNQKNNTYRIYSCFKKKIIENLSNDIKKCVPIPLKRQVEKNCFVRSFSFQNPHINFNKNIFPIGEQHAISKLQDFISNKLKDYSVNRNCPILQSTSMLSPYLSLGVISPRYCLNMLLQMEKHIPLNIIYNYSWLNQILWREFYYHLLIGFPSLGKCQSLLKWEKNIVWNNSIKHLQSWKEGNTGFPIVDAGMRQLHQCGWMHNRLRMITSSFLVKNLLIDWRQGEKYFISHLIDGDFALNNGGWQWSASVGTDSVPYTRIFNPYHQSKKFDKSGYFIKKFIPELKSVPNAYIHEPHVWSKQNNCKLDYPNPIIDYQNSRKRFLLIFAQARVHCKNR